MRRGARIVVAAVVALPVLAALVAGGLFVSYHRLGPLRSEAIVVVPRGAGVTAIAEQLDDAGVVSGPLGLRLAERLQRPPVSLKAGEYRFPAQTSLASALRMLREGDTVQRRLTVPEGLTSRQVVALLQETPGLVGDVGATPAEGTLLPETYAYSWGDGRAELLQRMTAAMAGALDELWAERDSDLPLATPREAVVLASIVEKETGLPEERPRVAGVFMNRLRIGMRLQADPTVVYAVHGGFDADRPITAADLQHPSPYNTYATPGLPPGPIANPGRASLAAVLRPAATAELYFVADGSGGHAFAHSLEEHLRNVSRWRRLNGQ